MTRESVEGQACELDWIRRGEWDLSDADYIGMVEQKTCCYSFITPVVVGAIAARLDPSRQGRLSEFARRLGVAFQIQDDILNLTGDAGEYGKEIDGDLWEGKRTLILLHMMRSAAPSDRAEAARILALPRPVAPHAAAGAKRAEDIRFLRDLIARCGSVEHARRVAGSWAGEAQRAFDECAGDLLPGAHKDLLQGLIGYVIDRVR
jgi:geranylgeranyl diphosphate synthase type II